MKRKQYWLWVDGQRRYYDYPPEPAGYTPDQLTYLYLLDYLHKPEKAK